MPKPTSFGAAIQAAPGGGATALAVAPDGKTLAAAGATVHVRDARSGKLLANLAGPRAPVAHLLFARDGRLLVAAEETGTVRVWALAP